MMRTVFKEQQKIRIAKIYQSTRAENEIRPIRLKCSSCAACANCCARTLFQRCARHRLARASVTKIPQSTIKWSFDVFFHVNEKNNPPEKILEI